MVALSRERISCDGVSEKIFGCDGVGGDGSLGDWIAGTTQNELKKEISR